MHELQKRNLTRWFNIYDADGDGGITLHDADVIIKNFAEGRNLEAGSEEYNTFREGFLIPWNALSQATDLDHDGRVTLDEWMTFHEDMLPNRETFQQLIIAAAQAMFTLIDADKDHFLSMEECRQWMHAYRIPGEDIVEEVFEHLDLNGHGKLDMGDIETLLTQLYYSEDPAAPGHWLLGKP